MLGGGGGGALGGADSGQLALDVPQLAVDVGVVALREATSDSAGSTAFQSARIRS
jgi:hypothetical protein